jgi:hypothetical protein
MMLYVTTYYRRQPGRPTRRPRRMHVGVVTVTEAERIKDAMKR